MIEEPFGQKIKLLIDEGGVVLCANEQDADFWRARWLGDRAAATAPPILSWRLFLTELNEALETAPVPLSNAEELWLWREVVHPMEAASAVRRAWQIVREYALDATDAWLADAAHCADWARQVEMQAQHAGVCLRASWPQQCVHLLRERRELLPKRVDFAPGFSPPPALEKMLRALDVPMRHWRSDEQARAQCFFLQAEDEHDETTKAAEIVSEAIAQKKRVGILTLDADAAARVRRLLARPPYRLLAPDEGSMLPMLRAAIDWLDALLADEISAAALRRWGWVAGRSELGCALALQRPSWPLRLLAEVLLRRGQAPLARALQQARAWRNQHARFDDWAQRWQRWLEAMQLLRPEEDDPFARAAAHLLREGLLQLARLAALMPEPVPARRAFAELAAIWRGLPTPRFDAPVALLSFEEGVYRDWDLAVVLGCDEARLPWGARPVPLLQIAAQVAAGVPDANAHLARTQASQLWGMLLARSKQIVALSAAVRGGEENAPSFWVREWTRWEAKQSRHASGAPSVFEDPVRIEAESAPLRHGVALLDAMAACPFQAQARFRWELEALEEPAIGVDPRLRGSVLHKALAAFWGEVKSQQRLIELDRQGKSIPLLGELIDQALQDAFGIDDDWRDWLAMHAKRVLRRWLDVEKRRKPFVVHACEEERVLAIGTHELKLRIDRIDEDEDGRIIVIDYKTGSAPEPKHWCADPVRSWQMPAYLLAVPEADAGVFASLRLPGEESKELDWFGVAREGCELGMEGVRPSDRLAEGRAQWQALAESLDGLRSAWRQRLGALVDDFVSGKSQVSPIDDDACKYCGLEDVCRIKERMS